MGENLGNHRRIVDGTNVKPQFSELGQTSPRIEEKMKFALIHLSGERRGETQYFDCARLSLGNDPANDLVFPADGRYPSVPLHVELFEADCQIHFRNQDPNVTTLVNHNPLIEATLQDQDLIQLGPEGPKLRLRIRAEEYATCKRSREIFRDALDIAAEARHEGRGRMGSFVAQLVYDVRRHASLPTQLVVITLLVVLLVGLGGLGYYAYSTQRAHEQDMAALLKELESTRLTQADLENRTAGERKRIAEGLASRQAELDRLAESLRVLEREGKSAEILIKKYGFSIGFLYGAYGFLQKGQTANVPDVIFEYMGTGFLIDQQGLLVTNRHLFEPWLMDPSGVDMLRSGLQPKLVRMQAYFPEYPQPYDVSLVRVSEKTDVGLGRLSGVPPDIPPIPLGAPAPQGIVGEAVVVLGYPVGVEGLLARMDHAVADALLKKPKHNLRRLVQDIAAHDGIRPLATQGHIGDIVHNRIVYDAQTTGGASGSPVFNNRGEVIAVNAATMTHFGGASFGVPISEVLTLISSES